MVTKKLWGWSIAMAAIVFTIFSLYLFMRRGYYNLYIINKVLGSTSAVVAGVALLIGPLSKRFSYFTKYANLRKPLGFLALYLIGFHIIVSLVQFKKFPFPSWYIEHWLPILLGFCAFSVWLYMKTISSDKKIKEMGFEVWKSRLSLMGKLAFTAAFFHLVIMKYQGWLSWFKGLVKQSSELANPSYPPASLFVFVFMLGVLLYRLINDLKKN